MNWRKREPDELRFRMGIGKCPNICANVEQGGFVNLDYSSVNYGSTFNVSKTTVTQVSLKFSFCDSSDNCIILEWFAFGNTNYVNIPSFASQQETYCVHHSYSYRYKF